MPSYQRMILTLPAASTTNFVSQTDLHDGIGPHEGFRGVINYLQAINGGQQNGTLTVLTGATYATATLTSTGAATATETCSICNVTFTARASGATGNEFDVSATVATQATNIANAINNSTDLEGIVTAEAAAGVVTITAVAPGAIGNGLQISESLTNVTLSSFLTRDTGADGDSFTMDLS
jgi:hypothetical protein